MTKGTVMFITKSVSKFEKGCAYLVSLLLVLGESNELFILVYPAAHTFPLVSLIDTRFRFFRSLLTRPLEHDKKIGALLQKFQLPEENEQPRFGGRERLFCAWQNNLMGRFRFPNWKLQGAKSC